MRSAGGMRTSRPPSQERAEAKLACSSRPRWPAGADAPPRALSRPNVLERSAPRYLAAGADFTGALGFVDEGLCADAALGFVDAALCAGKLCAMSSAQRCAWSQVLVGTAPGPGAVRS